jgi:hypothetical protein
MKVLALALATLLTSCGSVVLAPDADVTPPDAAVTLIEVTVLSHTGDGAPVVANVVSTRPTGELVAQMSSGPTGKIQIPVVAGGSVTVIENSTAGGASQSQLTTIVGVAATDKLLFGMMKRPVQVSGLDESMSLSYFPTSAPLHNFFTTCGVTSALLPAVLKLFSNCHGQTFTAIATANITSGSFYSTIKNVNFINNGTISFPAFIPMDKFAVFYSNAPSNLTTFTTSRSPVVDGRLLATQSATGMSGVADFSFDVPFIPAVGDKSVVTTLLKTTAASGNQELSVRTATLSSSLAVDLRGQPLPWITAAPVATKDGASWTQLGNEPSDLRSTVWTAQWMSGGSVLSTTWTVYDHEQSATLTLPQLPTLTAETDPRQQAIFGAAPTATVQLFKFRDFASDRVRQSPESFIDSFDNNAVFGDIPTIIRKSQMN